MTTPAAVRRIGFRRSKDCKASGTMVPGWKRAAFKRAGSVECCDPTARATFKRATLRRAGAVETCGGHPGCLEALENDTDTVINWPLGGTLADISGNGINALIAFGGEIYENLDPCLQGFRFDGGAPIFGAQNSLKAPFSPLLLLGGEMSVQFIWLPRKTTAQQVFQCQTGVDPDRRNDPSVYEVYYSAGAVFDWRDHVHPGTDPSNDMLPAYSLVPIVPAATPILFTWRRRHVAGAIYAAEMFANDVLVSSLATGASVPVGDEIFGFGGLTTSVFAGAGLSGVGASVRVSSSSRTNAQIAADARHVGTIT